MNRLSTRPSATDSLETAERNDESDSPILVNLHDSCLTRTGIIGARAARLSQATRSALPVPAGSVLTAVALGHMDRTSRMRVPTSADALASIFEDIGKGGRIPLMVSASAVSRTRSTADRIAGSHGIIKLSELLHTVRRFSATASVLGDTIAAVVQRDIAIADSGTLIASPTTARIVASIRSGSEPSEHARLVELGHRIAEIFDGDRLVTWATDRSARVWILDIGPADGAPFPPVPE